MTVNSFGWSDLRKFGSVDKAGRWYPCEEVVEYFYHIRSPSRAWPNSYAKAAQTKKFAKWCLNNRPDFAARMGLI